MIEATYGATSGFVERFEPLRTSKTLIRMSDQLTIEQYEVLVKRMKILSQSQTAFLKVC